MTEQSSLADVWIPCRVADEPETLFCMGLPLTMRHCRAIDWHVSPSRCMRCPVPLLVEALEAARSALETCKLKLEYGVAPEGPGGTACVGCIAKRGKDMCDVAPAALPRAEGQS